MQMTETFSSLLLVASMLLVVSYRNGTENMGNLNTDDTSAGACGDSDRDLDEDIGAFNYAVGTQTFSPSYQFTEEDIYMETAKAIRDMGSNIIKTIVRDNVPIHEILDMPFAYYFLWYRSQTRTGGKACLCG